jgi:UDP-N-acetylglucosamine--N-acetylmuramyl-(pentapeptide) pyrophosphoryl-undecaprenol N-acetylglucosamine transferase
MKNVLVPTPFITIACGGTGGHLFPGLAVAEQLMRRGCEVTLLISPKDVDQQAVKSASSMQIVTLPVLALQGGQRIAFLRGFVQSYCAAKKLFQQRPTQAVLAMGGFTSAPPILAAKRLGTLTFLHESNTIPGRANRWLACVVNQAFIGFSQAADRLHTHTVTMTGTPVRPLFRPRDPATCRAVLGFDPALPLVLIMGGSQGARGVNDLVIQSLPRLAEHSPALQWLHLSGPNDVENVKQAYAAQKMKALVYPFLVEMEIALGAATVAISRAGASSLAELAATCVPTVLVPFPSATDNHQFYNARAFEETGAARLLEQKDATPEKLEHLISELVKNPVARKRMQTALAQWHAPKAAQQIADRILEAVAEKRQTASTKLGVSKRNGCCGDEHPQQRRADVQTRAGARRELQSDAVT